MSHDEIYRTSRPRSAPAPAATNSRIASIRLRVEGFAARRAIFERGPSIQNASVLQIEERILRPISGSALLDAAALVEQGLDPLVRDDELLATSALGQVRLDLVGKPVHVDDCPLNAVRRPGDQGNNR